MKLVSMAGWSFGTAVLVAGLALAASALSSEDSNFLKTAAKGGMAEVELGRLATRKASNPKVKEFGSRMVRDHSKANTELTKLAASRGVELPKGKGISNDTSAAHLKMLSGKSFDEAYVKMMVDDHKEDIEEFEKAANGATDSDVKEFASKTLPTLKEHLNMIQEIQDSLNTK
jgi:putative membrane protein